MYSKKNQLPYQEKAEGNSKPFELPIQCMVAALEHHHYGRKTHEWNQQWDPIGSTFDSTFWPLICSSPILWWCNHVKSLFSLVKFMDLWLLIPARPRHSSTSRMALRATAFSMSSLNSEKFWCYPAATGVIEMKRTIPLGHFQENTYIIIYIHTVYIYNYAMYYAVLYICYCLFSSLCLTPIFGTLGCDGEKIVYIRMAVQDLKQYLSPTWNSWEWLEWWHISP